MRTSVNVKPRKVAFGSLWLSSVRENLLFYLVVVAMLALCRSFWSMAPTDMGKVMQQIQDAHAAGDFATTDNYVRAWLPAVAKVNFWICVGLLILGPWLTGRTTGTQPHRVCGASRRLWLVTSIMIVSSGLLNVPRLFHSFWNDEEWTARRLVVGEFQDDGKLKTPSWNRTLFFYIDPNNHPLFSVLARLSHSAFAVPLEKAEFAFQEWPIRLPAYLFGIGGLAALAWLAETVSLPRAGMIAVSWLALHPWHVRYGVDARGYALLFAWVPLSMALLWRSLARGTLNSWMAFGLVEFLVLWTYPGALYFVVILNLVALAMLATTGDLIGRGLQWRRFVAGSVIGAVLTTLMLSPCVQPMLLFLKGERLRGDLPLGWMLETGSGLLTGVPWARWADHDLAIAWMRTWDQQPWLVAVMFVSVLAALVAGVLALGSGSGRQRWLLVVLLAVGPFMYAMAKIQGNFLYPWYMVLALPGVALVIGAGVDSLASRFLANGCRWGLPVAFLGLFATATWGQNQVLRDHPVEAMRESVAIMRTERNALTADLRSTVLTGSTCYPARLYDPAARPLRSAADLRALMAEADARHIPMFVNFADQVFFTRRDPAMMALLNDRRLFEEPLIFPGIHNQAERNVFHYLGQPKLTVVPN